MDSLTDDLWALVLAKLPIRIFTCFKVVCKQWKSVMESPFFRKHFVSMHENSSSSSSWLLMSTDGRDAIMDYYHQCDIWGLKRPLSSFIKSALNDKNPNQKYLDVKVVAYSDLGLILIYAISKIKEKSSLYVANPVSHECVEIFLDPLLEKSQLCIPQWGIATRVDENDILLSFKVVVVNRGLSGAMLNCLIYSSETGMWSLDNTPFSKYFFTESSISLNGNLHWFAINKDSQDFLISMDLYTNSTSSDRWRVSHFPDLEKTIKFDRSCCRTPCHGFLMYINIVSTTKVDGSLEEKLCVWRLQSEGWQLISQISPGSILTGDFINYAPLTINPFDAKTAYFWSEKQESMLYINLHTGKSLTYNQFELTSNRRTMIPAHDPRAVISLKNTCVGLVPFVLPQWLYRIPNMVAVRRV
ncbi:unnamed protein product [Eruca vesicaria subsp. sativa]|uniref:F-box domain-containing protein n=1 Tax=Eruca vesicaria subsp. sativa TaxID=29727 RepID=A0ABC8JHQ7_ERUVS|nr:unnamed protein product [Eruca vesicaria subsp. sativa]